MDKDPEKPASSQDVSEPASDNAEKKRMRAESRTTSRLPLRDKYTGLLSRPPCFAPSHRACDSVDVVGVLALHNKSSTFWLGLVDPRQFKNATSIILCVVIYLSSEKLATSTVHCVGQYSGNRDNTYLRKAFLNHPAARDLEFDVK